MSDVTVLLTVWKRPHLARQLAMLAEQSEPPAAIWVYHCARHVDAMAAIRGFRAIPVNYIHSDEDLGYFGRFAILPFVDTPFVAVIDDDLMPGREWLAYARDKVAAHGAVVSTCGTILPRQCFDLRVGHIVGGSGDCPADTWVDFGCNSWMLRTDWARRFWTVPPAHLRNAEDMHFGAAMAEHGIGTLVPDQRAPERSGNGVPALGADAVASWRRKGYDEERAATLAYLRARGWRTLAERNAPPGPS
ncbi:MAG: glycosyltransferase family 2 protein [Alphaproteobacteria bacterium]